MQRNPEPVPPARHRRTSWDKRGKSQRVILRHTVGRVAVMASLAVLLVACGSGSTASERVFKPKNPRFSNLYLQVRGTPGVVAAVEHHLLRTRTLGGFMIAAKAQGQPACTVSREIGRSGPPSLQRYAGEKLRIIVYGDSRLAPRVCRNFGKGLSGPQNAKVGAGGR